MSGGRMAEGAWLALLDWRRRMQSLYATVRGRWADDPSGAHALWCAARDELFAHHAQSPLPSEDRARFRGLPYYGYDPAFAFTAAVEPRPVVRLDVLSSTGQPMSLVRFGMVRLPVGDLDIYWMDVYGGGVFLPFRDSTAGRSTYGGGRYVLDTVKGADLGGGEPEAGGPTALVVDLNFAYNPSCAYDPQWSCPLAPPGNHLTKPVEAGERHPLTSA